MNKKKKILIAINAALELRDEKYQQTKNGLYKVLADILNELYHDVCEEHKLHSHNATRLSEPMSVIDFIESCGHLITYTKGKKVAERFRGDLIPVIEFNELREQAKKCQLYQPTEKKRTVTTEELRKARKEYNQRAIDNHFDGDEPWKHFQAGVDWIIDEPNQPPMKTLREIAMKWWNSLSTDSKVAWRDEYFPNKTQSSLTEREIEIIFKVNQPSNNISAEQFYDQKSIELNYKDFEHYIDCRECDVLQKEIIEWAEQYAKHLNQEP